MLYFATISRKPTEQGARAKFSLQILGEASYFWVKVTNRTNDTLIAQSSKS